MSMFMSEFTSSIQIRLLQNKIHYRNYSYNGGCQHTDTMRVVPSPAALRALIPAFTHCSCSSLQLVLEKKKWIEPNLDNTLGFMMLITPFREPYH